MIANVPKTVVIAMLERLLARFGWKAQNKSLLLFSGEATGAVVPITIPHALYMAYQATFCIITAALISGAIVERMLQAIRLAAVTGRTITLGR